MAVERVNSIYDISTLQAEQDKFIQLLQDSKAAIIDLNNQRITVKGADLSSFSQAAQDLNKAIDNTTAATNNAVTANKQFSASLQENIAQRIRLKNSMESYAKDEKENTELLKAGVITRQEYNQRLIESQTKIAQYKASIADLNKGVKDQVLSNRAAEGSYDELNVKLRTLLVQYKALSASDRDSAIGKQLQKDILSTNTSLQTLDAGLGNHQRNVGNYSSALTGYANTLRGLRGPTKLLGEALGIGAQEADQFRLVIEHSLQGIAAYFRGKEAKTEAETADTLATAANTASQEANTASTVESAAANEINAKSVEELVLASGGLISAEEAQIVLQKENILVTEAQAVAQTELAVATEASSVAMKIFQNVLKFSGIALAITAIGYIIYQLAQTVKAIDGVSERTKILNSIEKEAAKTFTESTAKIEILQVKLNDLSISQKDRIQYAKEYNDTADKANQIDLKQIDNITEINNQITKQISLLKERAIAQAGANLLAKKAEELFAAQLRQQEVQESLPSINDEALNKILSQSQAKIDAVSKKLGTSKLSAQEALSIVDLDPASIQEAIKGNERFEVLQDTEVLKFLKGAAIRKKLIDDARAGLRAGTGGLRIGQAQEEVDKAQADFDKTLKTVAGLIGVNAFKTSTATTGTKSAQDQSALLKEYLKKDAEQLALFNEQELKSLQEKYKSEYEDQNKSENDRLAALKNYYDVTKKLIDTDTTGKEAILRQQQENDLAKANQIKDLKLREATKQAITREGIKELSNIELDGQRAQEKNDIYFTQETIKIIDDGFKKEEKELEDHVKNIKQIQDERNASIASSLDQNQNTAGTEAINQAILDLQGKFGAKREKIQKQLQDRLTQIDDAANIDRLSNQGDALQQELANALLIEAPTEDIEDRITANAKAQSEARLKQSEDEYKRKKALRDAELDQVNTFSQAVLDLEQTFGDASFTNAKNKLADQQKVADAQEQIQIDAVNNSQRTEQEKADAIAIIQARADADKKARDAKAADLDYRKAQFDKKIAILETIANIAIDIAKQDYAAAALAGIALIKLVATPIPKYKGGRGTGKAEFAYVGDGGVNEYIHRQDGSIERTPAVETLTHLMPKDKVYKNKAELMKELAMSSLPLSEFHVKQDGSIGKEEMHRMTNKIVEAVDNIHVSTTLITKAGWRQVNNKITKTEQWVQKYIKG